MLRDRREVLDVIIAEGIVELLKRAKVSREQSLKLPNEDPQKEKKSLEDKSSMS